MAAVVAAAVPPGAVVVVVAVDGVVLEEPRVVIGLLSSLIDMVVSSLPTERRTCWLPRT